MSHTRTLFLSTHQWILYGCAFALAAVGMLFAQASIVSAAGLNYSADTPITVGGLNLTIRLGSAATSLIVRDTNLTIEVASGDTFTLVSPSRNAFTTLPVFNGTCIATENAVSIVGPVTATITPQPTTCVPQTFGASLIATIPVPVPAKPEQSKEEQKKGEDSEKSAQVSETKSLISTPEPASKPAKETKQPVSTPSSAAPKKSEIAKIEAEAAVFTAIPKSAKIGAEEKEILQDVKEAGLNLTTVSKGKAVEIPAAQKLLIISFLAKDTASTKKLDFEERVDLLKEAAYFNDGKLPKNKSDVAEVLKLAKNIPLSDNEIGKNALAAIKRNEKVFCPQKTCKGFTDFDKYMRGVEPLKTDDEKEEKGIAIFKKIVKRTPDMENPLHRNLVTALAYADLSGKNPAAKAKPAKNKKK